MKVMIGHASIDERGRISGGKAGDQTGKEVYTTDYYNYYNRTQSDWYVLRPNNPDVADKIAQCMQSACNNDNIGYDQYQRDTLYYRAEKVGFDTSKVSTPCETDCSALVRVCCNYAGIEVGDFYTGNERRVLLDTGAFTGLSNVAAKDLRRGDILVTKTQGHTAVVLSGPDDGYRREGGYGNDRLYGGARNDVLVGNEGNDTLYGRGGNDRLDGGYHDDTLVGGAGNDTLVGGAGRDVFVFNTALNETTNVDVITDFTPGRDKIRLSKGVFSNLRVLTLNASNFRSLKATNFCSNAYGAALDRNDYILYNTRTGALLYDADGSGRGAAVQFATLQDRPRNVSAEDFFVVL